MLQKFLQALLVLTFGWQLAGCAPSDSASSPSLRSLSLSTGTLAPEFNSTVTQYKAYVGTEVTTVEILAIPQQSDASVSVEDQNAKLGSARADVTVSSVTSPVVTVTVIAADGRTRRDYFVTLIYGDAPVSSQGTTTDTSTESGSTTDTSTGSTGNTGTSGTGTSSGSNTPATDSGSTGSTGSGSTTNENENTVPPTSPPENWQFSQRVKSGDVDPDGRFGMSVAANDDYLIAGSPLANGGKGRVDIYRRSGQQWIFAQGLTPNHGNHAHFGSRIAISGDYLVVSAPGSNLVSSYRLQQGRFEFHDEVRAVGAIAGERFGSSLALDGNTLAISNLRSSTFDGEVQLYSLNNGTWQYQTRFSGSQFGSHDEFANALALQGDLLAVGSFAPDNLCGSAGGDTGSVQLFQRRIGQWSPLTEVRADDGDDADRFGYSIALSGDTLAIGSQCEDGLQNGNPSQGAVYVYQRSGNHWRQSAKLSASNGTAHSLYGDKVLFKDTRLVVGASYESSNGLKASGAVYVYDFINGQWQETDILRASNSGTLDRFSWSMAVNNHSLIVGAPKEDSPNTYNDDLDTVADSGSVYIFN